ncbi:helix-turn-helix domain-containing protein [Mycoplasmatota bacterium]|nr:helix-turn-helix domain-containing protein [Mycoplasmatota bacterium]
MEFKDKLVFARAKLDLSQSELAKELNVSLPTISRWENGKVNPTKKAKVVFMQFCRKNNIEIGEEDNDR